MPRAGVPGLHPKPCHGPRNGSPRRESCTVVRYPSASGFVTKSCGNGGVRAGFGANADAPGYALGCGVRVPRQGALQGAG